DCGPSLKCVTLLFVLTLEPIAIGWNVFGVLLNLAYWLSPPGDIKQVLGFIDQSFDTYYIFSYTHSVVTKPDHSRKFSKVEILATSEIRGGMQFTKLVVGSRHNATKFLYRAQINILTSNVLKLRLVALVGTRSGGDL
ncbi:hypothetical protein Bhyg_09796, partial [Pseudolycoriella hygida]